MGLIYALNGLYFAAFLFLASLGLSIILGVMGILNLAHGSLYAIEGITSPCGRVLGKMGHTERRGTDIAKNLPGNKHQPLFKAGVEYF